MGISWSSEFDYTKDLLADTVLQSACIGHEPGCDPNEYSKTYRAKSAEKGLLRYAFEGTSEECRTIWDIATRASKLFADREYFGVRVDGVYKWQTYSQVYQKMLAIGAALRSMGCQRGSSIGIMAPNRPEWVITAFGAYSQTLSVVALYSTLGPNAVEYILNHAELTILFVAKKHLVEILPILSKTKVRHVVQFDVDKEAYGNVKDAVDAKDVDAARQSGVELIGFSTLIQKGIASGLQPDAPGPEDLAYIMYTSGTTGNPKGACLTHVNIISTVAAVETIFKLLDSDVHYSFLPLAHIFETDVQVGMAMRGARVGFWQDDIRQLVEDLCALQPTIMFGVPRVFTRIYQKVFAGVDTKFCLVRALFHRAYAYQADALRKRYPRSALYDNLVFSKAAAQVGLGNCRIIVSGAAPLPPYLCEFLKILFNCPVLQGYGMTETAAAVTISLPTCPNLGHVGPPVASSELRLRSVPEMNYNVTDEHPRGEIQMRGSNIFKGYFKNEEATEGVLNDGWMSSGDIGRLNPNGTFSIIDRKKNIFKLSQGEYVAAEMVEAAYGKSPMVSQIWIYGNSYKSFVVGVVVPNSERFIEIGRSKGWYTGPGFTADGYPEAFAKLWDEHLPELKHELIASLRDFEADLKGFEKARDFIVEFNVNNMGLGFTEENEMLTPTFKLRRANLLKTYMAKLRDTYKANGEPPSADEIWSG